MKINKFLSVLVLLTIISVGCADLDVPNTNQPDTERALSSASDLASLLEGSFVTMYSEGLKSTRVVNLDLQADYITSTNAFRNYWGDADEPRRAMDNSTTFDDKDNIEFLWSASYSAISAANNILGAVERGVFEDEATQLRMQGGANFIKGLATGVIGYVYDSGWIVDPTTEVDALGIEDLVGYTEMIDEGVRLLDVAIGFFNQGAPFDFLALTDGALDSDRAARLANSYKARFLAGKARSRSELSLTDWNAVKTAAQNGLQQDYSPISDENVMFNGQHAWWTFQVDGAGASYLPVDLQITNMADPASWKVYTTTQGEIQSPIETDDQRFGIYVDSLGQDFVYTTSIGWLNEARNRSIFSNYSHFRYQYGYQETNTGNPMHLFTAAEVQMLEAEAEYQLGNYDAAKAIIDAGARTVRGGLPPLADASAETIENAIYYENLVELAQAGCGTSLAYMRRYDRLQAGSFIHLPVPARDIELLRGDPNSFGGSANVGSPGTADGSNAWK